MNMTKKLKSCPFCGDEGDPITYFREVDGKKIWSVSCQGCHCDGPVQSDIYSEDSAIKEWNQRGIILEK